MNVTRAEAEAVTDDDSAQSVIDRLNIELDAFAIAADKQQAAKLGVGIHTVLRHLKKRADELTLSDSVYDNLLALTKRTLTEVFGFEPADQGDPT